MVLYHPSANTEHNNMVVYGYHCILSSRPSCWTSWNLTSRFVDDLGAQLLTLSVEKKPCLPLNYLQVVYKMGWLRLRLMSSLDFGGFRPSMCDVKKPGGFKNPWTGYEISRFFAFLWTSQHEPSRATRFGRLFRKWLRLAPVGVGSWCTERRSVNGRSFICRWHLINILYQILCFIPTFVVVVVGGGGGGGGGGVGGGGGGGGGVGLSCWCCSCSCSSCCCCCCCCSCSCSCSSCCCCCWWWWWWCWCWCWCCSCCCCCWWWWWWWWCWCCCCCCCCWCWYWCCSCSCSCSCCCWCWCWCCCWCCWCWCWCCCWCCCCCCRGCCCCCWWWCWWWWWWCWSFVLVLFLFLFFLLLLLLLL